ncbi:GNAT family N-acetyltransferase [Nocardioides okcheonensis]|uniref:GNAT family N-acetyltransferase n=1 Tax=Nocardioides okcheonensis TaxID=2894081 RepID=UPI001E5CFB3B|nr:GNAT family protein [Nocardioides okcheonensis]UFN45731.1 GNAT family N-acetyltransferase [Nocardioides okcheonensis]
MLSATDVYPPFGLRVVAGPIEMRGLTDELILELCDVAERGIHDPDEMPFYFPWSTAPAGELSRNTAAYHWSKRSTFRANDFCLDLAVLVDGRVVGSQGVAAKNFPVTRTGETGSWLGREHQGRGIGTAMRRAFCALLFDHLGFEEITSAAFLDNPASLGVSRKVGYVETGLTRVKRREGELARTRGLLLTPETFVRDDVHLEVTGAEAVRGFIGIGAG